MSVGGVNAMGAMPLPPGSEKRTDAERAALGFERMLLVQLTQQLAKTSGDEKSQSPATQAYRDMLPGATADALVAGGGIGLAKSISEQADQA